MSSVVEAKPQSEIRQYGPRRDPLGLQLRGALDRFSHGPNATVAEDTPDEGHSRLYRGGSVGKRSFVVAALGESQESLALLTLSIESADPRLNQAERPIVGDHLFGQRLQPTLRGRYSATQHVSEPMARDKLSHKLVVRGRDGLPDRLLDVARLLQPRASPPAQGRHEIGPVAPKLVEQELGEEDVVAEPLSLLIERNHEQVRAGELAQDPGRTLPARHSVAKRARHRPQYRGLEQKPPHILRELRQNLIPQQAHDVAVGAPERFDKGVLVLRPLQGKGGEVDPRGPSFGVLEQYADVIGLYVQTHLLVEQAFGFLLREGELFGADLGQLPTSPEPPQRQRRVGAAGDDEV